MQRLSQSIALLTPQNIQRRKCRVCQMRRWCRGVDETACAIDQQVDDFS
jgi:hypothetical protein